MTTKAPKAIPASRKPQRPRKRSAHIWQRPAQAGDFNDLSIEAEGADAVRERIEAAESELSSRADSGKAEIPEAAMT